MWMISKYNSSCHCLILLLLLFCCRSLYADEESGNKQWIYQQIQLRLDTAQNEQNELRSYLQNAIDNMQLLEITLEQQKRQNAALLEDLRKSNDYLTRLQTVNDQLRLKHEVLDKALVASRQKQKTALIVGILVGSAVVIAGGVTIGVLAAGR